MLLSVLPYPFPLSQMKQCVHGVLYAINMSVFTFATKMCFCVLECVQRVDKLLARFTVKLAFEGFRENHVVYPLNLIVKPIMSSFISVLSGDFHYYVTYLSSLIARGQSKDDKRPIIVILLWKID